MSTVSSYEAIQKFGLTYYSSAKAALSQRDKNEGNNDGGYSVREFVSSFSNMNSALFRNDYSAKFKADSLVNLYSGLFEKYAGSDSVLDAAEYVELINSEEYRKFISQYNSLKNEVVDNNTGIQKTGSTQSENASPLAQLDKGDMTQEMQAELKKLEEMKPQGDKRFGQILTTADKILDTAGNIMQSTSLEMSKCLEEYMATVNSKGTSEEETSKALEKCEEKLEKIQKEALEKIQSLEEPMHALKAISDITNKIEPGQVDLNEPLEMILSVAGQIQEGSNSNGGFNISKLFGGKKSGTEKFGEQEQKADDKIKEQTKIIKDNDSSESEKTRAQNNIQIWLVMKDMFKTLEESIN